MDQMWIHEGLATGTYFFQIHDDFSVVLVDGVGLLLSPLFARGLNAREMVIESFIVDVQIYTQHMNLQISIRAIEFRAGGHF
jgi:hypothetical protein